MMQEFGKGVWLTEEQTKEASAKVKRFVDSNPILSNFIGPPETSHWVLKWVGPNKADKDRSV